MSKYLGVLLGLAVVLPTFASPTPVAKDWEEISNDEGIRVWRKEVEGSPVVAFRGEAVIDAPIGKISAILADTSRKKEWVAKIEEAKDIHLISEFERIEYNHTGTPIVLKDRDFVFHAKARLDKAKRQMVLKLRSVEDPRMPPTEYVRGRLLESSYILTSIENHTKTHLVVEIHADPMGSVAKWIVNLFQKSWPRKAIEGIRNQAAKKDVIINERVQKFFTDPSGPMFAPTT